MSKFSYYKREDNAEVVELCVDSGDKLEYIGKYNNEEFCEFIKISKEEFIKIGTSLNIFKAPNTPIPIFIQD